MGYDLTRFVGEVDEEFQCSICSMVFENPVETPCGHAFCDECIAAWIPANATCPTDRTPLSQSDLKTPGRLLINLLAKLKITCNFGVEGCKVIVDLGQLQNHLAICKFNPNSEVTCNKGCNGKIQDHQKHNCFTHLMSELLNENIKLQLATAIRQDEQMAKFQKVAEEQNLKLKKSAEEQNLKIIEEIRQLKEQMATVISYHEVQIAELTSLKLTAIRQEKHLVKFQKLVEEPNMKLEKSAEEQKLKLEKSAEVQNMKLNNEILRLTELMTDQEYQIANLNEEIRGLKEQMSKPKDILKLNQKWKFDENMLLLEESNILVSMSHVVEYAKSSCSLTPENASFTIEVLVKPKDFGNAFIGLFPKDGSYNDKESIWFYSGGTITYSGKRYRHVKFGVGDVIECGIKYPQNFNENESQEVVVYLSKNGNVVHEHSQMLPPRLFPTIALWGIDVKVKVHQ